MVALARTELIAVLYSFLLKMRTRHRLYFLS